MKMFRVIGHVTLSRCHPSFDGARLLATEKLDPLQDQPAEEVEQDLVVVWDELGAGLGSQIAVSDGAEAAQPFRPELKPVDAFCAAILNEIHVDPEAAKRLKH